MPVDTEKFREVLTTEDQLAIYAEFYSIMNSIVELSRKRPRSGNRESIKRLMNVLTELRDAASVVHEGLKQKSTEDVIKDLEIVEKLFKDIEKYVY